MSAHFKPGVRTTAAEQLPVDSRYELVLRIASGGMATVYLARARGPAGFSRIVAVKRAHRHLLEDPAFRRMLAAEARLACKIHHPNAVAVQGVEELPDELLLVMEYIEGPSLAALGAISEERCGALAPAIVVRIILDACAGLHAAHELTNEAGRALGLVHRDVSPQNLLVGADGTSRLADFGIAKSTQGGGPTAGTATGALKGKVGYMAPEYVESGTMDARGDVFSLGVVLWEALTGTRLFRGSLEIDTLRAVAACEIPAPSTVGSKPPAWLDSVVLRALRRSPDDRYPTAKALGQELERRASEEDLLASHSEVADVVAELVGDVLEKRRHLVRGCLEQTDPHAATVPESAGQEERITLPMPTPASRPVDGTVALEDVRREGTAEAEAHGEGATGTLGSGVTRPSSVGHRSARKGRRRNVRALGLGVAALAVAGASVAALGLMRTESPGPAAATTAVAGQPTGTVSSAPTGTSGSSALAIEGSPTSMPTSTEGSASTSTPVRSAQGGVHAASPSTARPSAAAATTAAVPSSAPGVPSSEPAAPSATAAASKRPEDKAPPNPYGPH